MAAGRHLPHRGGPVYPELCPPLPHPDAGKCGRLRDDPARTGRPELGGHLRQRPFLPRRAHRQDAPRRAFQGDRRLERRRDRFRRHEARLQHLREPVRGRHGLDVRDHHRRGVAPEGDRHLAAGDSGAGRVRRLRLLPFLRQQHHRRRVHGPPPGRRARIPREPTDGRRHLGLSRDLPLRGGRRRLRAPDEPEFGRRPGERRRREVRRRHGQDRARRRAVRLSRLRGRRPVQHAVVRHRHAHVR